MHPASEPLRAAWADTPAEARARRRLAAIAIGGALLFLIAFAVAAALYPGGTWTNRRAPGHSLLANYLCDLMQERALNGQPAAVGALVIRAGALAMFIAIGAFYLLVARLERPPGRAARLARGVGVSAAAIACTIPFLTSDRSRTAHLVAVVATFLPALVATVAAARVCLRSPQTTPWIRAAALVALVAGSVDGFLYIFAYGAHALGLPPPLPVRRLVGDLIPVLQRIASVGVIAWVLALAARARR